MLKRVQLLVSCLVLLATACNGGLPKTDVDLGSGRRFVPQVVDSIANVGVSPSVSIDPEGNPVFAYLGYPSVPKPGEIPETRPVTLPLVPAVMYATEKDGAWTVGTVQQLDAGLTQDVDGEEVPLDNAAVAGAVDASGALNVVWMEKKGLMFAKDEGGQFVPSAVAKGSGIFAPSIAIGPGNVPWISFYRSGELMVSTLADGWRESVIAEVPDCGDNCPMVRTSIQVGDGGPVVAFADAGGASVATFPDATWTVDDLQGGGGYGISLALDKDGAPSVSYVTAGGNLTVARNDRGGWSGVDVGSVKLEPSASLTTGVAVDGNGTTYVTWYDSATDSVRLAIDQGDGFQAVSTPGTEGGGSPSIAALPGGSAWVAWYDSVNEDLQAAAYADQDTVFAAAQPGSAATTAPPPPTSTASSPPPPTQAPPTDGGDKPVTLSITAPAGSVGTGFTEKTLKAPAGTPIKLIFDNQDTGVPHNVEIWTADPLKDTSATSLFVGDQTTGPAKITYDVPALDAGTYFYRCVVHPTTMTGTLTVS